MINAIAEENGALQAQMEEMRSEKEKLRGDVIEECAALMDQWANEAGAFQDPMYIEQRIILKNRY